MAKADLRHRSKVHLLGLHGIHTGSSMVRVQGKNGLLVAVELGGKHGKKKLLWASSTGYIDATAKEILRRIHVKHREMDHVQDDDAADASASGGGGGSGPTKRKHDDPKNKKKPRKSKQVRAAMRQRAEQWARAQLVKLKKKKTARVHPSAPGAPAHRPPMRMSQMTAPQRLARTRMNAIRLGTYDRHEQEQEQEEEEEEEEEVKEYDVVFDEGAGPRGPAARPPPSFQLDPKAVEATIARQSSAAAAAAHAEACGRHPVTGMPLPGPTHIPSLERTHGMHPRALSTHDMLRELTPAGMVIAKHRQSAAEHERQLDKYSKRFSPALVSRYLPVGVAFGFDTFPVTQHQLMGLRPCRMGDGLLTWSFTRRHATNPLISQTAIILAIDGVPYITEEMRGLLRRYTLNRTPMLMTAAVSKPLQASAHGHFTTTGHMDVKQRQLWLVERFNTQRTIVGRASGGAREVDVVAVESDEDDDDEDDDDKDECDNPKRSRKTVGVDHDK